MFIEKTAKLVFSAMGNSNHSSNGWQVEIHSPGNGAGRNAVSNQLGRVASTLRLGIVSFREDQRTQSGDG
jgi:hypothetical protein